MPLALAGLVLVWGAMLLVGGLEFDRGLLVLTYAGRSPELIAAARAVTWLGDATVLLPVTLAGAVILAIRRDWRQSIILAGATLSGRLIVDLQKDWTERLRPDAADHLVAVQSSAFPSAHAANAVLVWFGLALLLPRTSRGRLHASWIAAWLALAVGASRVMLGVHWPSDVIAGWSFGLLWLLLVLWLTGQPVDEGTSAPSAHSSP